MSTRATAPTDGTTSGPSIGTDSTQIVAVAADSAPAEQSANDDSQGALSGKWLRGRYRVGELLGRGGMADVYSGSHRNGKRVAIKVLRAEHIDDRQVVKRFVKEGYVANAVDHDGVVRVDDDDVTEEGPFLVMELLDGQSLDELRRTHAGQIAPGWALALGWQLCDVLVAAHAKGIVHRDIKPANLFLTKKGELKVLDFGIARFRDGSSHFTSTDMSMGTPAYAAPEQIFGKQDIVDHRADIYSTGATLYHLISGNPPRGDTGCVRPLADVMKNVHPSIAAIVDRCLCERIDDRWPDAWSLKEAIASAYLLIEKTPLTLGMKFASYMRRHTSTPPNTGFAQVEAALASVPESVPSAAVGEAPANLPLSPGPVAARSFASSGETVPPRPVFVRNRPKLVVAILAGTVALIGAAALGIRSRRGSEQYLAATASLSNRGAHSAAAERGDARPDLPPPGLAPPLASAAASNSSPRVTPSSATTPSAKSSVSQARIPPVPRPSASSSHFTVRE